MPDLTTNLGLKKPIGTETVTRSAYNENLDILDNNVADKIAFTALEQNITAHKADDMPHQFTDTSTSITYRWGLKLVSGIVTFIYEEGI